MKTIETLWNKVKDAHSAAVADADRYYNSRKNPSIVEFVGEIVPMVTSMYFARAITNLIYSESRGVVRSD